MRGERCRSTPLTDLRRRAWLVVSLSLSVWFTLSLRCYANVPMTCCVWCAAPRRPPASLTHPCKPCRPCATSAGRRVCCSPRCRCPTGASPPSTKPSEFGRCPSSSMPAPERYSRKNERGPRGGPARRRFGIRNVEPEARVSGRRVEYHRNPNCSGRFLGRRVFLFCVFVCIGVFFCGFCPYPPPETAKAHRSPASRVQTHPTGGGWPLTSRPQMRPGESAQ